MTALDNVKREWPTAPQWDWRDQVTCCICAPHYRIITSADWKFLCRLERRNKHFVPTARHIERLEGIVNKLDDYAIDQGIVWP